MRIDDGSFVGIEYSLSLDSGEAVDSSEPGDPLGFVFGAGQVVPGLERNLRGLEAGARTSFVVEPEDGYGTPDPKARTVLSRSQFPDSLDLEVGMVFQASSKHGNSVFRIASVSETEVAADFNHPLAGERLHFDIHVVSVRRATEQELEATQHGCGCCCGGGEPGGCGGDEPGGCGGDEPGGCGGDEPGGCGGGRD